jgi:benzodiazapine receptor
MTPGWKPGYTRLVVSLAVCQLAGLAGSVFTVPAIPAWYATISKPAFTPPNWVFAPAWTTLFILMGLSLWLVWSKGLEKRAVRTAVIAFGAQLFLNILWSALFFGLRSPFLAFIEIIFLWIAIAFTILLFSRIEKRAAWLLIPYILWVSFAAFLNWSVWLLNP